MIFLLTMNFKQLSFIKYKYNKKKLLKQASTNFLIYKYNRREEGIRTLDTLVAYTHFPGVRLRPLGHLSKYNSYSK